MRHRWTSNSNSNSKQQHPQIDRYRKKGHPNTNPAERKSNNNNDKRPHLPHVSKLLRIGNHPQTRLNLPLLLLLELLLLLDQNTLIQPICH